MLKSAMLLIICMGFLPLGLLYFKMDRIHALVNNYDSILEDGMKSLNNPAGGRLLDCPLWVPGQWPIRVKI